MTTIENLHTFLNYDTTELKHDLLSITWNGNYDKEKEEYINKELNDLMGNEYRYNPENGKASYMWLEEFKKCFNYELGKKMYILIKANADGYFDAWKEDENNFYYDMYIDEEGYINVEHYYYPFKTETPKYSREIVKIYIRPDCIYNDNIYNDIKEKKEIKEKEEKKNNYEMALKNLKSGDIINFDSCVYLVDKHSCNKYKVIKVCSKTIKMEEMWLGRQVKTYDKRLVKKERLLEKFKNYGFTITRE
jgi:hypothetical protein